MQIPKPTQKGYTIYTKESCKYCHLVKELLKKETFTIVECDSFLKEDREWFLNTMQERILFDYRTFPMVFRDGVFLGGYTETKKFIDQNSLCFDE